MGMDFLVNVNIKTKGAEKVDALERQIESLDGKRINLDINTSNINIEDAIRSQLTRASSDASRIGQNIGNNLNSSISRTLSSQSRNIGNEFIKNLTTSISKSNIDALIDRLNLRGVSKDVVDTVRNNLDSLSKTGIQINSIKEKFNDKGLFSIKIDGIDEAKNAVSILETLNKKTNEWRNEFTYTSNFKSLEKEASKITKETNSLSKAQERLFTARGNIGSLKAVFGDVSEFTNDFIELDAAISDALNLSENGDFSQLSVKLADIEGRIKTLTSATNEWHKVNQTNAEAVKSTNEQAKATEKYTNKQKELLATLSTFKKKNATLFDNSSKDYNMSIVEEFDRVEVAVKSINSISSSKVATTLFDGLKASVENLGIEIEEEIINIDKLQKKANSINDNSLSPLIDVSNANKAELGASGYLKVKSYIDDASNSYRKFQSELSKGVNANFDSLNDDLKEFIRLTNKAESEYNKLMAPASATKQQNALNSLLRWGANNTKATEGIGNSRYNSLVSTLNSNLKTGQLDDVISEVKAFQTEMVQTGNVGKSFGQEVVRSFKQIGQFAATYGIIQNVIMEVPRRMVSEAIRVDDAMTTLRMATSLNNEEAKKLMDTYSELGNKLKATGVDVAASATEWLKQGKSIAEAEALASDSIILSKIGGISSEEATKTITAAMKSYNLAEDEVMGFIDKISSIDLVSATDVGGLSQAFNEVAANAKTAGVESEKLLAYAAVIGETSQEGMASVGTSLNAVFSRMGNIKLSRLKDYETGEDLSNVETVLRGVGISLRDGQDQFREFDDVLEDTANRWSSFSSVQQRAVAQAFSGTHHMNEFIILMQNWSKVQEYTTIANEASGQSMEKFSAYQESATGKIEGFKNAFQSMSMSVIDSDIFKGLIDTGTGFLTLLTDIISVGNGIPALLTTIGGVSFFRNLD